MVIIMDKDRENTLRELILPLQEWYRSNARSLPWRIPADLAGGRPRPLPDPYHVWISEIMLQQTRVEAVKGYYSRFLERLPDIRALAEVSEDELLKLWQGLGYYSRAKNLQKAARTIMDQYHGSFPDTYEEILSLPGIGEYTAGAVSSIAFGIPVPAIDGNVYRIYTRLFEEASDITRTSVKKGIRSQFLSIMPEDDPGTFNQAFMDLGATVCLPNGTPLCDKCPLNTVCLAWKHQTWKSLPVKPPKKKRQVSSRTIIIFEYNNTYFLQKRPEKGLLAGLWEFSAREASLSPTDLSALLRGWDITGYEIELLGSGKHIFTHVEWHMLGYLIHLQKSPSSSFFQDGIWTDIEKMQREYSIPSALRCYYEKLPRSL